MFLTRFLRFLVDEGSDLYYNPTPLLDSLKPENTENKDDKKSGSDAQGSPTTSRNPGAISLYSSTPTSARFPGNVPSPYANSHHMDGTPEASTPRRATMNVDGAPGPAPDVRRRVTRGMAEEGYPMY